VANIANDLNEIAVTVTSPDGRIEGRAESLKYLSVRFLHGSYEHYYRHRDPETLASQLARAATLMSTAYQRSRREVMAGHGFERYSTMRPPFRTRHRELLERGAHLTARGSSGDGGIQVTTTGLVDFQITIGRDVLDRHDEKGFLQLANRAMDDLRADHQRALSDLRHELYLRYKGRER
jgi:hypothetical protein